MAQNEAPLNEQNQDVQKQAVSVKKAPTEQSKAAAGGAVVNKKSGKEDNSGSESPKPASQPTFADIPVKASKDSPLAHKLEKIVSDIFSRCGVPISNFRISEPVMFAAKVTYNLNWNFRCRCQDKVIKNVPEDERPLSVSALDEFTTLNSKDLERGSAQTKEFIKRLSKSSFKELDDLSGQIIAFNRISAIGKTKCKTCHGSKNSPCGICGGKGHVSCPACHGLSKKCQVCNGKGFIYCVHCQQKGVEKCKDCKSTGEQVVEREIIYDAECDKSVSVSMTIPETNQKITSFNDEDQKVLIAAAEFNDPSSGTETTRGYNATFIGNTSCCAVHVYLEGVKTPFDFILVGKSLKAVSKPHIIDYVFANEASILSDTLLTSSVDVDEKIKCVKALASKAIITKTIRTIENHELKIAHDIAAKQGVTIESILNDNSGIDNARAKNLRLKIRADLLKKITEEFINNSDGFVSQDFARIFAKNLISFVPMLLLLNPNTKFIWAGITLVTWCLLVAFMYLVPTVVGALFAVTMSGIICAFTSFALTKNWAYYSAVSVLKLTHKFKKIPDLSTEAIQSGRLIVGAFFICAVALFLHYLR